MHKLQFTISAVVLLAAGCAATPAGAQAADTWINGVSDDGAVLSMADGHTFLVEELDRINTQLWLPIDDIVYLDGARQCLNPQSVLLVNIDESEHACARVIR